MANRFKDLNKTTWTEKEAKEQRKLREEYEEHKKKVMAQSNPSPEDYDELSYDDRDEWGEKYHSNLGF